MSSIWTGAFWKAAVERAIKTLAQTAAALLLADGTGLLEVDWGSTASVSGMAALISILTSVGTGALTDGAPSLTDAEVLSPPAPQPAPQP